MFIVVFFWFVISILAYVFFTGLLKSALKRHGTGELEKAALNTASQFSLKHGRRNQLKAEKFLVRGFKDHQSPIVVRRGRCTYWAMVSVYGSLAALAILMVFGTAYV